VTGIVIYGTGRHFSSGAILKDLIDSVRSCSETGTADGAGSSRLLENLESFIFFENLDIPVIAAVRGVCLGSALELALFCHARICGSGAVLGLPEATFGLVPGCGGIQKINELAGRPRALELVLGGSSFTAEEALRWKIVDKIVPKKNIVPAAVTLIKSVAGNYNKFNIRHFIDRYL
jgi:enoyl-CoA hydratase/carnithine racemase